MNGFLGVGDLGRGLLGATPPKTGPRQPPSKGKGAAPQAAGVGTEKSSGGEGSPWDVTGSLSDIFGVVATVSSAFNPQAALAYNSISFAALLGESDHAAAKPGPGQGTVLTKTLYPVRAPNMVAEETIAGAMRMEAAFLELRGGTNASAQFEVVFWVDGKDILAGYTQLASAEGFIMSSGATGSVQFGGTAFSKSVPSIFLLTFSGWADKFGPGDMDFAGSVAIRADGTMKALHCKAVRRNILPDAVSADPVAETDEDGVMWTVGYK